MDRFDYPARGARRAGLEVGKRFEIKQPRMPKLVWEVTEVDPGTSWTWLQRSPGGLTVARHEVVAESGRRTRVRQRSTSAGPLAPGRGPDAWITKRYLEFEAAGLKARSEQRRVDAPSA